MPTWITVCDSCKRPDWPARGADLPDGAALAAHLEAQSGADTVAIRRHTCLMGCGKGCNIAIQARGKICYTLGDFEPDETAAAAILAYARLHAQSPTGQVPYRDWPQGVKGHFVARHPPLPDE